ncbi:MAG: radical SAM protein [Clostridiales bacterium]|nr:radical SAM protein [Clostridiales bacterium]
MSFDMSNCTLCPRKCSADRAGGKTGVCGAGEKILVARAAAHYWEEPCISGEKGSGAVFFSGCSLKCVFCQNYEISSGMKGREVTVVQLRDIFRRLADSGVHNINLVNPTHFAAAIAEALEQPPGIPVVYNCGGYESVETLKMLEGKVQIYLPDMKYSDNAAARRYSGAGDYVETAKAAILEMYRQTGDYVLDDAGMLRSGVVIRHLILPGLLENSRGVIDWVDDTFLPGSVLFSLMSQYTPCGRAAEFPEINRRLTAEEYGKIQAYMDRSGIMDGFFQDMESAGEEFIPDFDFTGIDNDL